MFTHSVTVGKTAYPLKSSVAHGSLPFVGTPSAPVFRLLDGPPYANGAPHLGHVLNKHLKDAVARAASTNHTVEWRPGWDCHGLPLELLVEKAGFDRAQRATFVEAARMEASKHVLTQKGVFEQQGWGADWSNPYHTMDPKMEAGTLRVFAQLVRNNLVQTRFTSVPWCPYCQSTLSAAEHENETLEMDTLVVPFDFSDTECLLSWTTTPWTLPLHKALVVNPNASYTALEKDGRVAWVSTDTAQRWAKVLNAVVSARTCLGTDLEGRAYSTPWTTATVHASESVLDNAGTGVLHAVPGLSDLDTQLGEEFNWNVVQYLAPNGRVENSPFVEQNNSKAGPQSNALVAPHYENALWCAHVPYSTEHPHCWRHKTPLLTRMSRQVFLTLTDEVRERAHALVEQMQFTPESGRARLLAAMKNRPDWCLSRQRTWGVPLSVFVDKNTQQPHALAADWMEQVAQKMEQEGVNAWWNSQTSDWVGEQYCNDVERVDDVLDVWFDSGCVPQLVGSADVVVEGTDQHRGWFQSCLWVAAALNAPLPFKRVVTHGFVVDKTGAKYSKSTGGDKSVGKCPTWQSLPTDVVRVWSLMGSDGSDKVWSMETVTLAQSVTARLRNTLRFLLANSHTEALHVTQPHNAWDLYWVAKTQAMRDHVVKLCAQGKVGEAMSSLAPFAEQFSALAMNAWKDRLYCMPVSNPLRANMDEVVRACCHGFFKMLSVVTPRLADEAVAFLPPRPTTQFVCTSEQVREVENALALRSNLASHWEKQYSKLPAVQRSLVWDDAPNWGGQLVADALDVGQLTNTTEELQHLEVYGVWMGQTSDCVCPRCRRVQRVFVGDVCQNCV